MSQQTSTFTIGSHIGASNSNSLASPISYQLVCQRCFNPLQLDHDFEHLQKTELMTLIDATTTDSETSDSINLVPVRNSTAPRPRFIVPPNSALSLLNDDENPLETLHSYAGPTSSLDHRLKVNACLFDVLSGRTEVDHPLCQECADTLLLAKQQCLEFQEEELKCLQFYLSYLDSIAGTVEAKLKSKQATKLKSSQTKESNHSGEIISELGGRVSPKQCTSTATISKSSPDEQETGVDDDVGGNNEMVNNPKLIDSVLSLAFDDSDDDNYFDDDDDDGDNHNDMDDSSNTVKTTDKEIKNYKIASNSKKYGKNVNELEATLSALQSNLNELLLENDKLDKQIIQDTAELEKRTEELDRATTQYNDQKLALIEAEEEMQCLESRLSYARSHLHRLQRTNVLNIAFPIWYDGHIGVINGLHLGRLPNRPVGWEEINAAWGQCALLLQCIGKKLNYSFQSYLIVPMGSQSKVVQLSISKEFPLYYTTGGMRILSAGK
ncbi:Beclin-1 isoform 1 [Schistosoma japonicum]|nr:Beclin-1 isoform 1 [Schistosoma japonicum]